MENLIIVGCGEHFRANMGPTLASLEAAGLASVIATVDMQALTEKPAFLKGPVPHIIRSQGESLARSLREYRGADPVVVLAHSHDCHAPDALDLVSDGFRVILEKPYALKTSDLSFIRDVIRRTPERLALAEYYLMMKSAPLLHAAGLLRPGSFYLREPGYLEGVGEKTPAVENLVGLLDSIGRPRMVYVDLLEGERLTGRFEHRGRQFADNRVGIGVILDLAIHALAPVAALEGLLGSLPPSSGVSLATAVCGTFLGNAGSSYEVPPQFVPETYAELSFTTSLGIPVICAVGKYVLRNENQRRLLIVGDEGEALLDMSNCTLSVARTDKCPAILLRSPKRAETKYQAVFRACLLTLAGETPYNFNASEVALRSNEFTLELHSRACEQGVGRCQYPAGAPPGTVLQNSTQFRVQGSNPEPTLDYEGAKLYYEHQYERMAAVEDQGFKMSAGVFVLTAAVFTFASRVGIESFLPWWIAVGLMFSANFAAMFYMWRVRVSIKGHQVRAKAVLKKFWPDLWVLDRSREFEIKLDKWQLRSVIVGCLHIFVLLAAGWIFFHPPQTKTQQTVPAPVTQQPANQQTTQPASPPMPQQPAQRKP
jgi:predicted dehydrogenase